MRILLLSNALEMLAVALVLPAYPAITKALDIDIKTRGLMVSLFSLLQFLASPVLGRGSDVLGRSFMLRVSAVASVFCYAFMLLSTDQRMFMIARVLPGFFKCGISVSQAYISVRTPLICSALLGTIYCKMLLLRSPPFSRHLSHVYYSIKLILSPSRSPPSSPSYIGHK